MDYLPKMLFSDNYKKYTFDSFSGYVHKENLKEGGIWDMKNMSTDAYPALSTRQKRLKTAEISNPNGLYYFGDEYYVSGTGFYKNGVLCGSVSDTKKRFASLGKYIVIFPDKKYYDTESGTFSSLEATYSGPVLIKDGTYVGQSAEANTIYAPGVDFSACFSEGDAVTISGCLLHPENNTSVIIREVGNGELRFYENTFTVGTGGDSENITIKREVPELDFVFENENRLWGCKDNTVYASKLGDIFNFYSYDGISKDSYAVNIGSEGAFTGACSYLGYPCFFKADKIYKVYGDRPSNFSLMGTDCDGVAPGSSLSLSNVGGSLYYLSPSGFMSYGGAMPKSISYALGDDKFFDAVGGRIGHKYYVSAKTSDNEHHLLVYDTDKGIWSKEDGADIIAFSNSGSGEFLTRDGKLFCVLPSVGDVGTDESAFSSFVEFAPMRGAEDKKGICRLYLGIVPKTECGICVKVKYDNDAAWQSVFSKTLSADTSIIVPLIVKRCGKFRIKIEGDSLWQLRFLTVQRYTGSDM